MSREAKRPILVGTVILVFLSIFTKSQASSPFESMNSAHLSMCKKDVRPSVQKRWRTMAFSRLSRGDSGLMSHEGESLMGFLELWLEPGVYSRVTAGMSIRNSSLFIEVRNLSRYEVQIRHEI